MMSLGSALPKEKQRAGVFGTLDGISRSKFRKMPQDLQRYLLDAGRLQKELEAVRGAGGKFDEVNNPMDKIIKKEGEEFSKREGRIVGLLEKTGKQGTAQYIIAMKEKGEGLYSRYATASSVLDNHGLAESVECEVRAHMLKEWFTADAVEIVRAGLGSGWSVDSPILDYYHLHRHSLGLVVAKSERHGIQRLFLVWDEAGGSKGKLQILPDVPLESEISGRVTLGDTNCYEYAKVDYWISKGGYSVEGKVTVNKRHIEGAKKAMGESPASEAMENLPTAVEKSWLHRVLHCLMETLGVRSIKGSGRTMK